MNTFYNAPSPWWVHDRRAVVEMAKYLPMEQFPTRCWADGWVVGERISKRQFRATELVDLCIGVATVGHRWPDVSRYVGSRDASVCRCQWRKVRTSKRPLLRKLYRLVKDKQFPVLQILRPRTLPFDNWMQIRCTDIARSAAQANAISKARKHKMSISFLLNGDVPHSEVKEEHPLPQGASSNDDL